MYWIIQAVKKMKVIWLHLSLFATKIIGKVNSVTVVLALLLHKQIICNKKSRFGVIFIAVIYAENPIYWLYLFNIVCVGLPKNQKPSNTKNAFTIKKIDKKINTNAPLLRALVIGAKSIRPCTIKIPTIPAMML